MASAIGVVGLRRGNDALRPGKLDAGRERVQLLHCGGLSQAQIDARATPAAPCRDSAARPHEFPAE